MTRQNNATKTGQHRTTPARTPRLRLKAKAPQSGFVDGAWWPRTDDLSEELPDLLAVLSVRLGPIERLLYSLNEWRKAAASVPIDGRSVRLDGYRNQPAHTVEIIGSNRSRIVLLLVPPNTDPDLAHSTLMAAAAGNDSSTVECLLTQSVSNWGLPAPSSGEEQERWESEGGARCRPTLSARR